MENSWFEYILIKLKEIREINLLRWVNASKIISLDDYYYNYLSCINHVVLYKQNIFLYEHNIIEDNNIVISQFL